MANGVIPRVPNDIVDLMPRIRVRANATCRHTSFVEIDMEIDELTCGNCGAIMNPWAHLRQEARSAKADIDRDVKRVKQFNDAIAEVERQANEAIKRLNDEIRALTEFKNELSNTYIASADATLGTIRARRRRRRA